MKKEIQMSEHLLTGILLAVTGGFLDAYTYICRGHVFANAQTGNIVLLGINLADSNTAEALHYLEPILAFFVGIFVAEFIKNIFKNYDKFHWRQIIITVEILLLACVSLIPQGDKNALANILISFVCSLQVESFRKMNGHAYATTMCTGNLRSGSEQLFLYFKNKDKNLLLSSMQYFLIILFFIAGAAIGAFSTNMLGIRAVLLSCISLIVVLLLMMRKPVLAEDRINN